MIRSHDLDKNAVDNAISYKSFLKIIMCLEPIRLFRTHFDIQILLLIS